MDDKKLGKIETVHFGLGGYQGMQLGLHLSFSSDSIGVGATKGNWDPTKMERSEHAKWTEEERSQSHDELCRFVSKILDDAKKNKVSELIGTPVELTFKGNTLEDWRVLTEVL